MKERTRTKNKAKGTQGGILAQAAMRKVADRLPGKSLGTTVDLLKKPPNRKLKKPPEAIVAPKKIVITPSRRKVHYETIQVEAGVQEIVLRIVIGDAPVMHTMMLSSNDGVGEVP